ncbi:uncharacterized protein ACWYII_005079 isoform 2-T3 [Salvelinus alpinus]
MVSLPLCQSVCLPRAGSEGLSPSLPVRLSAQSWVRRSLSLSASPSVCPELGQTVSLPLCQSVCLPRAGSDGLSPSLPVRLSAQSWVRRSLSLSPSPSVCPELGQKVSLPLCQSVCLPRAGSEGLSPSLPVRLSAQSWVRRSLSLSASPSVCPELGQTVSLPLCQSVCLPRAGSDGLSPSLPVRLSAQSWVRRSLSLSPSPSVCPELGQKVSLPLCQSVCLPRAGSDGLSPSLPVCLSAQSWVRRSLSLSASPSVCPELGQKVSLPLCQSVCLPRAGSEGLSPSLPVRLSAQSWVRWSLALSASPSVCPELGQKVSLPLCQSVCLPRAGSEGLSPSLPVRLSAQSWVRRSLSLSASPSVCPELSCVCV